MDGQPDALAIRPRADAQDTWLSFLHCGQALGVLLLIAGLASLTPAAAALSDYRSPALTLGAGWCIGGSLLMHDAPDDGWAP